MISIIAAIGANNELGLNNRLIWHFKEDMKFFRETTSGKVIVMGRKCFESLPNILPNRKNIILTSNKDYIVDNAYVYNNKDELLNYLLGTNEDVFIIGGARIYEEFINICDNLYLTEIDASSIADVYFPIFDKSMYEKDILRSHTENNIDYKICLYKKK